MIRAVGDPVELARALDDSAFVDAYRTIVDRYGLGFDTEVSELSLPGYQGTLTLSYAEPLGTTTG